MIRKKLTDEDIIKQFKSWNFGFICVNPNAGYSGTTRLIEIQNIISKEIIIRDYQNAKKNQVLFPKYENMRARNELNKLKFGWTCLDTWMSKNGIRRIRIAKIQHTVSKEIISCVFQDAKKNYIRFPKYENMKAKNELNKLKLGFICLDTWTGNPYRMAKLQHLESKEIITARYSHAKTNNVNFTKYQDLKAKNELNKLNYGWVCLETYKGYHNRIAKLQHLESKEIITCQHSTAKINQVLFPKYEDIKRFENVNKLGLRVNPQYVCVSSNSGRNRFGSVYVSIKRKDGLGKIKIIIYGSLQNGHNPYNEEQNRVEINKVHPKYEKVFKILNISYNKEFRLAKGSVIDFKLTHKNSKKNVVVEVKQSGKFHSYSKEQKSRYTKLANKLKDISKIYFSDPKGTHRKHGFISMKELAKKLIKDFNLNPSKLKSITSL